MCSGGYIALILGLRETRYAGTAKHQYVIQYNGNINLKELLFLSRITDC